MCESTLGLGAIEQISNVHVAVEEAGCVEGRVKWKPCAQKVSVQVIMCTVMERLNGRKYAFFFTKSFLGRQMGFMGLD